MGKPEKSPREQAEEISSGKTEPHHIGKMSYEVLQQEIVSLRITNTAFRGKKWHKRVEAIQAGINILAEKEKVNAKALSKLLRAITSGET